METENKARGEDARDRLCRLLARIDDPEEIAELIRSILTDAEAESLWRRWDILERLHDGMTQRAIAEDLGASLCKITRGSKILKENPGIASYLGSMSAKGE